MLEMMADNFLLRALVAGIGVAIIAGVMGCFVVWRRMAYFGDSLAHSALLGIALGLITGVGINISTVLVCLLFAVILVWLQQKRVLATDTLLGILAHGALSIGLVAISFLKQRVDLNAYLFGDILTVTTADIAWIYGGGAVVLALLAYNWPALVLMTIHEDLAVAENVKTFRQNLLFMFLMTVMVAISIHVVGILLITSMLIIPAATARQFARSPEAMAVISAVLGIVAVACGIFGSAQLDTPTGPSIVTAAALMFTALFPITCGLKRGMFIARVLLLAFSLFSCTLLFSQPVLALSQEEKEHVKSSFDFMERKNWNEAGLHAKASHDDAMQSLIAWAYALDSDSGASFSEIKAFMQENPDWPEQKRLRNRMEMALAGSNYNSEDLVEWFSKNEPVTGIGKITLVKILQAGGAQARDMVSSLVREAWRDGDFDESQEKELLEKYGSFIRSSDDEARASRLLWEGKTSQGSRMLGRLSAAQKKLYKARLALQDGDKKAKQLVADLPANLRSDSGLIYDEIRYFAKKDDDISVTKLLLAAPKKVPYPEKWWSLRERHIREALADGNITLASRLLAAHGQVEGQGLAEASWLQGLIALKYKKQPVEAYRIFKKMFAEVKYPVSKARAAYWAAKSAEKAGDKESSEYWYKKALAYPTSFYGQLAAVTYKEKISLKIPEPPTVTSEEMAEFAKSKIVRAIKLCLEFGEVELAEKLISHLAKESDDAKDALMVSELGAEAGKTYLSVRAAKKSMQNNVTLVENGYPTPKTPENIAVPRVLALAIARQESEFNNIARSPAGAIGLMQLLPATAKETAQKNGLNFTIERLYEPDYNITIGSLYLRKLMDNYDGTLPMAIAAYNAGMGNVYKWTQKFGKPSNSLDGMVDWIEKIPFAETRNYVQRVLENLQVYRQLESDSKTTKTTLAEDLLAAN